MWNKPIAFVYRSNRYHRRRVQDRREEDHRLKMYHHQRGQHQHEGHWNQLHQQHQQDVVDAYVIRLADLIHILQLYGKKLI
ncbi:hypothetical protein B9Z55_028158 [Caenorhabditis nigoni]|uniref:Uncharacterized protein n=1 Tax=Caenorhabditis nigoni TaxID=1611254 RepID=A0A2G5SD40_9PELO|nr:hypothetical protein B9Z55_028158 [Caenorhabditis nigoni]